MMDMDEVEWGGINTCLEGEVYGNDMKHDLETRGRKKKKKKEEN